MNSRSIFFFCFTLFATSIFSQLNIELLSTFEYSVRGHDVWGYVSPSGDEFAIMGNQQGVSIVDVTIPTDPKEVLFIPQQVSAWRDIKTWKNHAYAISDGEGTNNGILVIDFTDLPEITYKNVHPVVPGQGPVNHCHNIWIDELGYAYLSGCNGVDGINNGGVLVYDVATDEGNPFLVGQAPDVYSHDAYARDGILYSSEILNGTLSLFDVSDVADIKEISTVSTPFEFTHNAWLSDDGNTVFTTDEKPNAPVAAYDVSDPTDIRLLDQFRPRATLNSGVVPHNVHVWNDYLIISYYTDGCIIVDASRPDNLIEVGNIDTYFDPDIGDGFNGIWGAYPYFPSGNIVLSDIQNALHVVRPDYKRACHLEGVVTEKSTGDPILNARVTSTLIGIDEYTKINGDYKSGYGIAGTYEVTVSAQGYVTETRMVELQNGVLSIENFELENQARVTVTGIIKDAQTGLAIDSAEITTQVNGVFRRLQADSNGGFTLTQIFAGEYDFVVGKWGYKTQFINGALFDGADPTPTIEILLERGYEDVFSLDLGWTSKLEGSKGQWFRAVPIGIQHPTLGLLVTPEKDSRNDEGLRAYVTGQSSDLEFGKLVGTATLTSPEFNVGNMERPVIVFDYWLWATSPSFNVTDNAITVILSDGEESIQVQSLLMESLDEVTWKQNIYIPIADHFPKDVDLQVSFEIKNNDLNGLVDAGIDYFRIVEEQSVAIDEIVDETYSVFPNPSSGYFRLGSKLSSSSLINGVLSVYNMQGQLIDTQIVSSEVSELLFGKDLSAGLYIVSFYQEGDLKLLKTLVKTE